VTFPPSSILIGGAKSIFKFLAEALNAEPLKRVKVIFLGNGRGGKTSLLRALANQPLQPGDAGPDSTVGVSVDTLHQQLKPGFFKKHVEGLPDISYWDFAGQLEYSAAHDFFLSARQAVYVIIFSVMEERDSQLHQVACVHPHHAM
jgi:GTPase SAR1 family protein